jgi:type II secretory pathway pseudopilin PulG
MDCKITSFNKRVRKAVSGMTMVETLMAIGIASIMMTQVCALWFYSTRSFAAQASYTALDQDSQRALDWLSRDVRQATNLVSFATNEISFKNLAGQTLTYRHSGHKLRRITPSNQTVLLNDCEWLKFAMFQRTPISGSYDQYPTSDIATCKLIEVSWKCARRPYPTSPETTEFMQSARVVLRSK